MPVKKNNCCWLIFCQKQIQPLGSRHKVGAASNRRLTPAGFQKSLQRVKSGSGPEGVNVVIIVTHEGADMSVFVCVYGCMEDSQVSPCRWCPVFSPCVCHQTAGEENTHLWPTLSARVCLLLTQ